MAPALMPRQTRIPLYTRSSFPAPKFCPTKVVMEIPKGVDNGPVNHVNFAVSGPCCHYIGTQGVDAGLDDNVGSRIHDGLKSCRQADLERSENISVLHYFSPV